MTGKPNRSVVAAAMLIVTVLVVYGRVATHEFVSLDDSTYVYENTVVQQGLTGDGLRWAFTTCHASNWHPLTWLSHMLDCQAFGLEPGGHHLTSVALHAINAVLLFLALRWMTAAFWPSLFVAAMFALHPLRVESVAWVAERKDVLSGLCWMLVLLAWARYARDPGPGRYLIVVSCLALGLMAKPMLVTLPLVLLLLDYWPLKRGGFVRLLLEKIPLLLVCAGSIVVTLTCQSSGIAMGTVEGLSIASRLAHTPVAYATYLWKTIWPTGLAVFYPHPALVAGGAEASRIGPALTAAGLLAAITWATVRCARSRPYLCVGWLWFLGTLVPVIGLVQVGSQATADRYAYLPTVGLYIMAAWGVAEWSGRPRSRVVPALVGIVLVAAAAATWVQVGYWQDEIVLYERAIAVTRDNWLAHNNLGASLERRGDLAGAADHFERATRIVPGYFKARDNLGRVLREQGRLDEAREQFERALEIAPDRVATRNDLGNLLLKLGDLTGATAQFERVIDAQPDHFESHYNLGIVLTLQGHLAGAESHARRAVGIEPEHADAHNNLGLILYRQGQLEQARAAFVRALELDPDNARARDNLAKLGE